MLMKLLSDVMKRKQVLLQYFNANTLKYLEGTRAYFKNSFLKERCERELVYISREFEIPNFPLPFTKCARQQIFFLGPHIT